MPIFWSLGQTSTNAAIAPVSVTPKKPIAENVSASEITAPMDDAVSFTGTSIAAATHPAAVPGSSLITDRPTVSPSPSALAVDIPARKLKQAVRSTDDELDDAPTASEKTRSDVEEQKPEGMTPLLEEFFETASAAAIAPPSIDFPPDINLATEPPKPTPETTLAQATPPLPADPELGVIQVSDPRRDPELGLIELRNPLQDPELGILELRQISPPPPPRPLLFISTYVSAASSDNVFLVEDPIQGRFGDNYIRPGISVSAFPAIGPQTNLLASIETNLLRYEEQSASSYDEVRFRAGIRHRFSDRAYGQLGVSSQLLFREGYGDQFFTNNGIELTVGRRDPLTPQLTLDTFYQGQVFFSDPSEFSNVLNSVGAYLGYRLDSQWDTGVGYRLTISDFTRQSRHETYQRITGQLRYSLTPSVRVSIFGGLSYGRSSEERITFDDTFFGISFDATIQVF